MKVQIQPVAVFPDTATQLELVGVNIRRLSTNGYALVAWQLKDANDQPLKSGTVDVSGAEYQAWNDDEPYLLDLTLAKLGLTKA